MRNEKTYCSDGTRSYTQVYTSAGVGIKEEQDTSAREMDLELDQVRDFVREGTIHVTLVEAVWEALKSLEQGWAKDIHEAMNQGREEWYK